MTNRNFPLFKEEYEEPRCVLCMDQDAPTPIPQRRVREKLDEYMSRRDYAGAERHLNYWLAEARQNGDLRGEFFLRNEMMGHYRKAGNRDQAILNANEGVNLIERLGFENTLSAGTAYVNAATVYDAFGMPQRSIELFEKARAIYEGSLPETDGRLGGLYNNMGLAYMALKRFGEAYAAFLKALDVMAKVEGPCGARPGEGGAEDRPVSGQGRRPAGRAHGAPGRILRLRVREVRPHLRLLRLLPHGRRSQRKGQIDL